jgi:hypothetical protein
MHLIPGSKARLAPVIFLAAIAAGCSGGGSPGGGSPAGGGGGPVASGGSSGQGGSEVPGGSGGYGAGGQSAGGSGVASDAAPAGGSGGATDAGPLGGAGPTPEGDGGGTPGSYEGELTIYAGPPVGPEVKMACPEDPTAGWTEYKDTFHVERPYDVPINTRFKLEGGIYTFWVMSGDKPHTTTTAALNPRTEARYTTNFTSGMKMWSADVMLESNVKGGTIVMQVHTTATGIGPVYIHAEGDSLGGTSIKGSDVPGGLYDNWFNMKVAINGATTESQIYINNCLKSSMKGTRGDGNDYFKHGVYHCGAGVCRDHFKNIHLYMK